MDPETPTSSRARAIDSILPHHEALQLELAARLGARDAEFETSIRGGSMSPAIPALARLRVRLLAGESCRIGEIAFFVSDAGFTVHRVTHLLRDRADRIHLITMGDDCLVPDPPVRQDWVLGTVVAVQTNTGWSAPGPLVHRSVCHRLTRIAASATVIVASWFGVAAARSLATNLQRLVAVTRAPAGRILRVLHLMAPRR